MPKEKQSFENLKQYIPEGSFDALMHYISRYKVHLTITRQRVTILGDYRHPIPGKNHRISVNGNLNKYSFLVTLLHELAHLFTFEKFNNRVLPHGNEWKAEFAGILAEFVQLKIFPEDIQRSLYQSISNPKASSCSDTQLLRVLKKYDAPDKKTVHVEDLNLDELFVTRDGKVFKRGEKRRTRYFCEHLPSNRRFLVHALMEVMRYEDVKKQ